MTTRAVVLGLDGATLDVVEPWVQAGALPTFAKLLDDGAYGRLRSTTPPITPIAWPTIYTGTNPGKHGIFGFEKRVTGEYRWAKSSALDLQRQPVWELLRAEGVRSGVFFAPYTYPTRPIEGWIVAGRGAPTGVRDATSSPTDVAGEMARRFGATDLFGARRPPGWNLDDITRGLIGSIEATTDAVLWAMSEGAFDFVFAVWDQTDTAGHLLWHHSQQPCPEVGSPMFDVYRAIDRSFARVLETIDDDVLVLVCSDHGAYPITHRVRVPLWLEREGLLAHRRNVTGRLVSRAGDLWVRLPERLRERVPGSMRAKVGAVHQETFRQNSLIEWERSRVYPQPVSAEAFFLNLAGREPNGIVTSSGAEGVLDDLAAALETMEALDGRRLVTATVRGTDAFEGPYAVEGPDLIAHVERGVYFSPTPAGTIFDSPDLPSPDDPPRSLGYHDPDGLVIVRGPGVTKGQIDGASVADIAPTLLRYLGAPVPGDLDGVGLDAAFGSLPPARVSDATVAAGRGGELSEAEEADIERQLRDLGYIE